MRMWVRMLVALVSMLMGQLVIMLGSTFATGRVPVWVTVHDVAMHVRVLVDEVHAKQQVAVGEQRVDRSNGGRLVILSEDHSAIGEAV